MEKFTPAEEPNKLETETSTSIQPINFKFEIEYEGDFNVISKYRGHTLKVDVSQGFFEQENSMTYAFVTMFMAVVDQAHNRKFQTRDYSPFDIGEIEGDLKSVFSEKIGLQFTVISPTE